MRIIFCGSEYGSHKQPNKAIRCLYTKIAVFGGKIMAIAPLLKP